MKIKQNKKNKKPNKQKNRSTEARLEVKDWGADANDKYPALEIVGWLREDEGLTLQMGLQHFPFEKTQKPGTKRNADISSRLRCEKSIWFWPLNKLQN